MIETILERLRRQLWETPDDRNDPSDGTGNGPSNEPNTNGSDKAARTLAVETATDVGRQRAVNEDTPCETPLDGGHLVAVADGMGGHQAGDVASQTAVETLVGELKATEGDVRERLDSAIAAANDAVNRKADEADELSGMGTTLVAAILRDGDAVIGNVGDSRAYLVGEEIEQVTEDQSLVRELIESGTIEESEAENHPQRHVLAQALGTDEEVDPDFYERSLDGRTLLLCSDGLTEEVSDETIREVVVESDPLANSAEALVDRANENGGSDNVSVVLAGYENG